LRGPGGELLGLVYLSERHSELPYSERDQKALAAIGSTCGLALYRLRARENEGSTDGVDAADLAARECVECGLLHDADTLACRCGAPLQRAPVPLQLRGQLRFIRRIGTGAMGVVYEARDIAVHQPRAVKALPETDAALMARLRHEARTMAAVSHSNLATFYALESWRSAPLLVMELCQQGTLADRLRRGALPVDQALAICSEIADALGYLHTRGVVHRDVKPSNIGFTDESVPKLLDFGLAKLVEGTVVRSSANDASTFTASMSDSHGAIRGTPAYLSPEALNGGAASPADDLWSLSVTLLEACVAANPFKASTPAATAARVMVDDGRVEAAVAPLPRPVAELIRSLLDRRLDRRPLSAAELQQRIHLVHPGVHHG
jgi:serine/threonine protein kinase